jgi:hypothetical protein
MKNQRGGFREGAGRKRGFASIEAEKAREFICKRVAEELGPIVASLIEKAKKGDVPAIKELFDRAWGKPIQEEIREVTTFKGKE